ncbi:MULTISPECIES: hypothetical protein [unclassified Saccharopolyspora]|uniref:hypothetical protein n=1 Tax=unclassified Saccharopolyspora TaxID=2646250 RepID=UPI001CD4043D|nr:hypothetical protein [Saccharopolyspora sp. 6T]MCA1191708.1 hypothetical protein [Saccharopolyspora sp. 6V]
MNLDEMMIDDPAGFLRVAVENYVQAHATTGDERLDAVTCAVRFRHRTFPERVRMATMSPIGCTGPGDQVALLHAALSDSRAACTSRYGRTRSSGPASSE